MLGSAGHGRRSVREDLESWLRRRSVTPARIGYTLVFVSSLVAWYLYLVARLPHSFVEPVVLVSGLGAALTTGTAALVRYWILQSEDAEAVWRAKCELPLVPGRRGAAIGEVHPASDLVLAAPFSGEPALVYEYDVYRVVKWKTTVQGTGTGRRTAKGRERVSAYTGYGFVPCEIGTALGPVRLVTRPALDVDPEQEIVGKELRSRACAYVAATAFTGPDEGSVTTFPRPGPGAPEPSPTPERKDVRLVETSADLEGWKLSETVVAPGQVVCAVGDFSEVAGGLVGKPEVAGGGLILRSGDAAATLGTIRGNAGCARSVAAVLVSLQAGLAVYAWLAAR